MQLDLDKLRKERTIDELLRFSIINIDKPTGPTSFSVSQFVMDALKVNKTSHLGTLDPMVTGVLPITLGRACRLSDFFMHRNKTYVGIMRLHEDISDEKLQEVIKEFIGTITQLPPVRSRVKREEREREIISFKIIEREGIDVLFETEVQAGTYIRKLIHDMGFKMGGAHMLELRRTNAGMFNESTLVNLYDLEKAVQELKKGNEIPIRNMLFPADWALQQLMPSIQIKKEAVKTLLTGKPLMKKDLEMKKLPDEEVFAVFQGEILIMVAKKTQEGDIVARPLFVLN